jgi:oligopeptide/dipeptide ABC transporter ATP-binding protein
MSLLAISGLYKSFNLEAGFFARFGRSVHAVNGVSLSIGKNEAYGLVGESGCGKTTTARLLVRMYEADSGKILYDSKGTEGRPESKNLTTENTEKENMSSLRVPPCPSVVKYSSQTSLVEVGTLRKGELREYRQRVRYVFQDPARSLNPRMNISEIILSGLRHSLSTRMTARLSAKQLRAKAAAALEEVGLSASDLERRPAEFSGGQRQRISIARGLLPEPDLLICDEVVSALDVSIQAQILNLLLDIRERRAMSFLFIAHDLKVACYFCDRIGVMYAGRIMEEAPAASLWQEGRHPYTQILFASATGAAPSQPVATAVSARESACAFAGRCPKAMERCYVETPDVVQIAPGHSIRCHYP